jgi:hypothetical protein
LNVHLKNRNPLYFLINNIYKKEYIGRNDPTITIM